MVVTGLSGAPQTLHSLTVTAPAAGVMLVRACGAPVTDHVNMTAERLYLGLQDNETDPLPVFAPKGAELYVQREAPSGAIQVRFCLEGHFTVPAGPRTFYLRGVKFTSSEFWRLYDSYISATFVGSVLP